ncbi:hypothetical protein [Falsiroseomonas sp.]|uniref:hypothetical protein n=1 Tax=Falsiroseomonas sp. TaxID=2870721 RepID=UPI003568442B
MMDAPAEIATLLAAVARGDRAALRAAYERQSVPLFGVANAILRDRDAAADALQDAFMRIAARAGQPVEPDAPERVAAAAEGRRAGVATDIIAAEGGADTAWVLAAGTLHMANLETGALTAAGPVTGLPQAEILDIAAMR